MPRRGPRAYASPTMSAVAPLADRRIRDLPGPPGLPLLGNLLQLDSTRLHLVAEGWSRTYGEFFRFRIGSREFLAIANPELEAVAVPGGGEPREHLALTMSPVGLKLRLTART